jgi:DNA-binding transcriptional regulator YiaG
VESRFNSQALERAIARGRARRALPSPAHRRLIRQAAGVSTRELAGAIGVDHSGVVRYENGERNPGPVVAEAYLAVLTRLAAAAGLPITEAEVPRDGHAA